MKLLDLEVSVARQLQGLPYPVYICAMCVIAGELRAGYKGHFSERGLLLSGQTIDAAVLALKPEDSGIGKLGPKLVREWRQLIEDPKEDGPDGWFPATCTFDRLAGELAAECRRYAAVEYLTDAAVKLPIAGEAATPPEPKLIRTDCKEEADEASAGVQLLRNFGRVAQLAAEMAGDGQPCDIAGLRAAVFG